MVELELEWVVIKFGAGREDERCKVLCGSLLSHAKKISICRKGVKICTATDSRIGK